MHPRIRAGSRDETGGIVTGWLFRLVAFVAIFAFVVFEAAAIAVNTVTVDDSAREVVRAAAIAYRTGTIEDARDAAMAAASDRGVDLVEVIVDGDELSAVVRSEASTIAAHRVPPLEDLTVRETTSTVAWR